MSYEDAKQGDLLSLATKESSTSHSGDELKKKVTEHYKLWILVRLHYEDLGNYRNEKYVDYETLLKTPCSSMFKYPLKKNDLDNALSDMLVDGLIEMIIKTENEKTTYDETESKNLKEELNDLTPDETLMFKLSIDGNLQMLYELNQVLKYENYEEAYEKLDGKKITLVLFLKNIIEKIKDGEDLDTVKKECLKVFLTSFNMFIELKNLLE